LQNNKLKIKAIRKILLILALLLISLSVKSQVVNDTIAIHDSVKIENINSELSDYGKQSFLTDKIALLEFGVVVCGAILKVPATPLLITTSGLNLIVVGINWKADKKLSEFNQKKEHKIRIRKKYFNKNW